MINLRVIAVLSLALVFTGCAAFLVKEGIESISLNPDTVIKTLLRIHQEEKK
jgi:phosphoenolpyruvate synthase/pyruvate phosphate dikinase